ncbi:ArsR family transcriptional regulator [Tenacibaculum holothuriorum]|uniref:ArsR family transcriptional regulator n=1 Tax=Tenacibaculum holothuriorum TaxID=1635173 RepID=A0A1Y2PFI7_9FLAO|nr:metalloregulator ArsR/SmtB family transcription factor [Tenacibaculum holothuriorum]OSY88781.1 ArsR family transcriptional regulator [Tenacibaculum holothuriorum]
MGLTKSEIFTTEQNNIATIAKVLGHPARIAIVQHLFKINSCVCGDLVEVIGLAQPTISQHLKELKKLNIIQGTIEGTSVCYCINTEKWNEIKSLLTQFLDLDIAAKTNNCC